MQATPSNPTLLGGRSPTSKAVAVASNGGPFGAVPSWPVVVQARPQLGVLFAPAVQAIEPVAVAPARMLVAAAPAASRNLPEPDLQLASAYCQTKAQVHELAETVKHLQEQVRTLHLENEALRGGMQQRMHSTRSAETLAGDEATEEDVVLDTPPTTVRTRLMEEAACGAVSGSPAEAPAPARPPAQGAMGMSRSKWMRSKCDIALCAMFGAMMEELRSSQTKHMYEESWVEDLTLLGQDLAEPPTAPEEAEEVEGPDGAAPAGHDAGASCTAAGPSGEAAELAPAVVLEDKSQQPSVAQQRWITAKGCLTARRALSSLLDTVRGHETEQLYDSDWVTRVPTVQQTDVGRKAWVRLKARFADPETEADKREIVPPSESSAAAASEVRMAKTASMVLEAFHCALSTGGCRGSAPATFTGESSEQDSPRGPSMFSIATRSPGMFCIATRKPEMQPQKDLPMDEVDTEQFLQPSSSSAGGVSPTRRGPMMVNMATQNVPRSRRCSGASQASTTTRGSVDVRDVGSAAWQTLRENLGVAGAVSALLYEMPWSRSPGSAL